MERYYSILKNLPTELLSPRLVSTSTSLEEIKNYRWLTRDTFLQISQSPFAAANGIGSDHLYNFLDLQDALIVKLLIGKLEGTASASNYCENDIRGEKIKICTMIQLVLSESPKLIEFLFAYPAQSHNNSNHMESTSSFNRETLKFLIHNCPALFNCTHLFKDFIHMDSYKEDKFYYWNFIVLLMEKYPIQTTFDLAKEVVAEIELNYDSLGKLDMESVENNIKIISKVFPMIDLTSIRKNRTQ